MNLALCSQPVWTKVPLDLIGLSGSYKLSTENRNPHVLVAGVGSCMLLVESTSYTIKPQERVF